jgi:WD40 repeat protein
MPTADTQPPSTLAVVDADNPWPGLLSFREVDQDFFRGREAEKRDLLRLVLRERASILYGLSGLGKTSLIQAGLFPLARREGLLPVAIRFDFSASAPQPVQQVKNAIAARREEGIDLPSFREEESLWEYFHRAGNEFFGSRLLTPLLVFDQFEEVFTSGSPIEALLEELADLSAGSPPVSLRLRINETPDLTRDFAFDQHEYRLLFSVREDYFASLEPFFRKTRGLELHRFQLLPMNGRAALEVVNQAPGLVEPAVSEKIVRFVAAAENSSGPPETWTVEPALLSLVCRELNDRRTGGRITEALVSGSRERILSDFYERSMQGVAAAVRRFVEDELLTDSGNRNSVPLENLRRHGLTEESLASLAARRLIHVGQWGATRRVEITHDRLTDVVRVSRDSRREREARELAEKARELAEKAREQAETELKESRRRTLLLAVLAGVAVLFLCVALWSQDRAQRAEHAANAAVAIQNWKDAEAKIAAGQASQGLAYLAHALGTSPESDPIRSRTYSLLTMRGWHLESAVMRHGKSVITAAFGPDSRQVVTASDDGTARVWNAATGKAVGEPLRHGGRVNSAAFSPDGRLVVTASYDRTAQVWEAATGKAVGLPLRHEAPVNSAAFGPQGRQVVTASDDTTARVWDVATGNVVGEVLHHKSPVNSAVFSPDGRQVLTASADGMARVWDAATGKPIGQPLSRESAVTLAVFNPNGRQVLTAAADGTAQVWDAATGKPIGEPLRHQSAIVSAAFSPDGRLVVTASHDGTARVWEAATGRPIGELLRHQKTVNSAAFSPDGRQVVTASADGTARVWEAATGNPIGEPLRHQDRVNSAAFSPDGRQVVTASDDQTARVWEAATGKAGAMPLRHSGRVNSAAISLDGRQVVTGSDDQTAQVWEAATGKAVGMPLRHQGAVNSAAFSPDGRQVVTASDDQTAQVWEAATGKAAGMPLRHQDRVNSAAFSPT